MKDLQFDVGGIRPIQLRDIISVGERLREQDMKELTLDGRKSQFGGLFAALKDHNQSYTIEVEGHPEGLFGVGPDFTSDRAGCIWMVGTQTLIDKASRTFGKASREVVDMMLKDNPQFAYVSNHVHEENTVAIQWLRWLGFTITKSVKRYGMNFNLLIKENPYHV